MTFEEIIADQGFRKALEDQTFDEFVVIDLDQFDVLGCVFLEGVFMVHTPDIPAVIANCEFHAYCYIELK